MHYIIGTILLPLLIANRDMIKPGYIINLQGDTIRGYIHVPVDGNNKIKSAELFSHLDFSDSTGVRKRYKANDIIGFGGMISDSVISHVVSYENVKMGGYFADKTRKRVFLQRLEEGPVSVFYLEHRNYGYGVIEVGEVYLKPLANEDRLIKLDRGLPFTKFSVKKDQVLPHLRQWPIAESRNYPSQLELQQLVWMVKDYNHWKTTGTRVSNEGDILPRF
jgi:hypothetical protein